MLGRDPRRVSGKSLYSSKDFVRAEKSSVIHTKPLIKKMGKCGEAVSVLEIPIHPFRSLYHLLLFQEADLCGHFARCSCPWFPCVLRPWEALADAGRGRDVSMFIPPDPSRKPVVDSSCTLRQGHA